MTTPDIQNLFERVLQMYGGQRSPTDSARSESQPQSSQPPYAAPRGTYGAEEDYAPTGGVLRGLSPSSPAVPWWVQALATPGGVPAGARRLPFGRFGGASLPPVPFGPDKVVEIPNPHLERFIPQSMRDFLTAATLLHRMLKDQGQEESASSSPRSDPNSRELRKVSGVATSPSVPEERGHPLRLFLKGMYGDGAAGDDAFSRCVKAAEGDSDDWENFCRFLDRRQNNTAGGESQNQACWSKFQLSTGERKNYCYNQFSKRQ